MAETLEKNPIETSLDDKIVKGTSFPTVTEQMDNLESREAPKSVKSWMSYKQLENIAEELMYGNENEIAKNYQSYVNNLYDGYKTYIKSLNNWFNRQHDKENWRDYFSSSRAKETKKEISREILKVMNEKITYIEGWHTRVTDIKNNIELWNYRIKWKSYENLINDTEYKWMISELIYAYGKLNNGSTGDALNFLEFDITKDSNKVIKAIQKDLKLTPDWKPWPMFFKQVSKYIIDKLPWYAEEQLKQVSNLKRRYNIVEKIYN